MPQHASNIPYDTPHRVTQHATDTAADMAKPLRATVEEAAKLLATSENALRKRIERGTLRSEKVKGVRYVLLFDSDMPQHTGTAADSVTDMSHDIALMQAHLDSMQEQAGYLKSVIQTRDEELRRKDHIIAALTERIPELEAAPNGSPEAREAPQTVSEEPASTSSPPGPRSPEERPSWWRRFLGLE
jgi:excisionase family DNA binding protein